MEQRPLLTFAIPQCGILERLRGMQPEGPYAHLGITTAILIGAGIAAAGAATSAVIGANAAHKAADTMAAGADKAGTLATEAAKTANAGIETGITKLGDINTTNQAMLSPYVTAGQTGLNYLLGDLKPGGSLNTPFTASQMEQYDPGYQFRLDQIQRGVQNSAASKGLLSSGGTLKDLTNYIGGSASSEFTNAFNRYLAQQNQTYQQLMGVTNLGQAATNTGIQSNEWLGTNTLQGREQQGSNTMQGANIAGQAAVGAANAQAGGTIGAANAWSNGITGFTNNVAQGLTLGALSNTFNAAPVTGVAPVAAQAQTQNALQTGILQDMMNSSSYAPSSPPPLGPGGLPSQPKWTVGSLNPYNPYAYAGGN